MDQDINMQEYIEQHCTESMNNALAAVKYTTWERKCPDSSDTEIE